jgi:hypothetical protein
MMSTPDEADLRRRDLLGAGTQVSAALIAKMEEEIKVGNEKQAQKAAFKIQITFHSKRSTHLPMAWTLSFWESGKRLHGGGDEMMFVCRRHTDAPKLPPEALMAVAKMGREVKEKGCDMLMPGILADGGIITCPRCNLTHRTEDIGDSLYYYGTAQKCAEVLEKWFRQLDSNADIFVKYRSDDPRTKVMAKSYGAYKAKVLKGMTIYPLENIIKDTAAGSSVLARFKALVTA